jgi:hypothetical protein
MTVKIDQKIVGYSVVKLDEPVSATSYENRTFHHEKTPRPSILPGATYKVKTPLSDHALYITINDIVFNQGTSYETQRPFEIFINSKAMEHFQWIVALTRIISAVFRKGGECAFLVEELRSVFDPKGGYFKKGGKYMPSLVAEIGDVIEQHLTRLGLYERDESLVEAAKVMVAEKVESKKPGQLCDKCGDYAVVLLDNCLTCLSCGSSKCG